MQVIRILTVFADNAQKNRVDDDDNSGDDSSEE